MPMQLLPASAKAYATRSQPNVVLSTRPELWLTHALKRVNKLKRPLNSVSQHKRCLEDLLAGDDALWLLASIMVERKPKEELLQHENKMIEALSNYQLLQIEGYVVHVDMVSQHEVAFKLTQDTIDSLIEYHKDIFSVDAAAAYTYDWPEKERQLKKLREDFVQAVNSFVYRANSRALEGLDDEGSGELLEGRSRDVKIAINNLMLPLLPPPPKIIDVIGPSMMGGQWWPQYTMPYVPPPQQLQQLYRPMEPWRIIGSSPSPTPTHSELQSTPWSTHSAYSEVHLPSPTPSYTQPYTCSTQYNPVMAPVSAQPLPLPSQLIAQQCSPTAGAGYGSNYWGYNDMFTPQYIQI